MYDPSIGRWLEEDPIGFEAGDANLYRYVTNGPTNAVDPTGLDKVWPSLQLPETTVADPNEAPAQAEIVEFFIEDKHHERFDLLGNGRGGLDITGLLNEKITLKVKVSAINPKTNHLSHTIVVDIRSGWPPDDPNTADAFQGGMRTDEGSRGEGRIEFGPGKQDFIGLLPVFWSRRCESLSHKYHFVTCHHDFRLIFLRSPRSHAALNSCGVR